jgi:hypothetical protein
LAGIEIGEMNSSMLSNDFLKSKNSLTNSSIRNIGRKSFSKLARIKPRSVFQTGDLGIIRPHHKIQR